MKVIAVIGILAITLLSAVANADQSQTRFQPTMKHVKSTTGQIDQLLKQQKKMDMLRAQVHSKIDLEKFQAATESDRNPLNLLSEAGRTTFVESLTFNEKGLTGFNYAVLEEELSMSQIHRILATFGSQESIKLFKQAKIKNSGDIALMSSGMCDGFYDLESDSCYDLGGGGGGGDDGSGGGGGDGSGGGGGDGSGGVKAPGDYLNYECTSRATCGLKENHICKASC
jgi:hypothetical protein